MKICSEMAEIFAFFGFRGSVQDFTYNFRTITDNQNPSWQHSSTQKTGQKTSLPCFNPWRIEGDTGVPRGAPTCDGMGHVTTWQKNAHSARFFDASLITFEPQNIWKFWLLELVPIEKLSQKHIGDTSVCAKLTEKFAFLIFIPTSVGPWRCDNDVAVSGPMST